jgi:cell division protease FtsH
MSGASLRNVLNEAAIVAARRNLVAIGGKEVDYAIDRILVGEAGREGVWGRVGGTSRHCGTKCKEEGKAVVMRRRRPPPRGPAPVHLCIL